MIRFHERVHRRVGRDEHVGLLAAFDTLAQTATGVRRDHDRVAGVLPKALAQLGDHRLHRAGAEHADLGREDGRGAGEQRDQSEDDRARDHTVYIEKSTAFSVMNSSSAGVPSRVFAIARLIAGTMSSGCVTRSPQPPSALAKSA